MIVPVAAPSGGRASRREWLGLAVLASACMLTSMDLSVLFLALPKVSAALHPSSVQLLWITDMYGFAIAGSLITAGTLGDRIGRRRLLMIGAVAFGAASILAAVSTGPGMLIAARGLLGVAGATIAPSTMALTMTLFADPGQRGVAMGIWGGSFAAGAAVGPILGGLLLHFFWWGSVFLLAVPVMVLLLTVGRRVLPEHRAPHAGHLDLPSALLSMAAVLSGVYGLKRLASSGPDAAAVAALIAGIALGVIFIRRQHALADPLVDLRVLGSRVLRAALATNTVAALVAFGASFLTAQYLQLVLGLDPIQAGLWSLPSAAAVVLGGMVVAPAMMARATSSVVVVAGLGLAGAGVASLALLVGAPRLVVVVTAMTVLNLGMGLIFTVTMTVIMQAAPPDQAGAVSGLAETGSELGGALGIAVLGSLLTAVYRHRMAVAVPAGTDSTSARAAQDTLAGAVHADPGLPHQVLDAAQSAFTAGLGTAALLSAAALIVLAVLATRSLRGADTRPALPALDAETAGHQSTPDPTDHAVPAPTSA